MSDYEEYRRGRYARMDARRIYYIRAAALHPPAPRPGVDL